MWGGFCSNTCVCRLIGMQQNNPCKPAAAAWEQPGAIEYTYNMVYNIQKRNFEMIISIYINDYNQKA